MGPNDLDIFEAKKVPMCIPKTPGLSREARREATWNCDNDIASICISRYVAYRLGSLMYRLYHELNLCIPRQNLPPPS